MPADWFTRETHPLLKAYCAHVVSHGVLRHRIDELQAALTDDDVGLYEKLLKMRDRESRALTTLATKLRLTNQSRYDAGKANTAAKRAGGEAKPWSATG